jgi:hypothetical protein
MSPTGDLEHELLRFREDLSFSYDIAYTNELDCSTLSIAERTQVQSVYNAKDMDVLETKKMHRLENLQTQIHSLACLKEVI